MPIDEAALMAAVNTGISEAGSSPAPAPTPTPSEPTGDDHAPDDSPAGDADGAADVGATGEAGDEGGPPADGGTPAGEGADSEAPADGVAADSAQTDEQKAAAAAKAAEAAAESKPKDPLNDPLPNALKKETKERIQTLVTMVKENTTKLETVTRDRDEILGMITETRATPEQYGQALGYLKLVNSPNRADREQALQIMQQEVAALARMLGKPVPGVNMLEGHQDLIDEVSTGRISPERAQEIAAARAAAQYELQRGQFQTEVNQNVEKQRADTTRGVRELNALEAQLKSVDPVGYAAKRKVLIESLKPVFKQIHPSQWAATFKRAYDALPAPAAPRVTPPTPQPRTGVPASGGGNTPLRASNPAGAAAPAPASLLDAVSQGIAEAR